MRSSVAIGRLFVLLVGLGVFVAAYTRPKAGPFVAPDGRSRVKLAVLVVFDQMRGDYPEKWQPLFGPGGFARLRAEGAWFTSCYYPYGTTTTGPGHASILTGTCPDRHGIVNNDWYEPGKGNAYCAGDGRYALVPAPTAVDPKTGRVEKPPIAGTPERLLSETVADVLKQTYGPRAKVFGLSLKDRSAILPTGRRPDGAFWFDGRFVTSTYYTDRLDHPVPEWVTAFNRSKTADRWFGQDWTRFRPDLGAEGYARYSGPDDAPGEGTGSKQGKTFPHPTTGGLKQVGKAYYDALANSPYGNDLLLEFAKTCVRTEGLGRDDVPALLVVSFSSNDLIGHTWGPDSQEVLDVTLRSDALVADLLGFLDAEVGRGNYALAVTADHGICPLPEASAAKGQAAKRVNKDALVAGAEAHLRAAFGPAGEPTGPGPKGKPRWVEEVSAPWVHLNRNQIAASGRVRGVVARSLADYLAAQPDVYRAYTRDELAGPLPAADELGRRVKRSFHPARGGDVYVVLRPFDLFGGRKPGEVLKEETGTTHGSPHDYDAFVPLMVYGPGVPGGPRAEPVTPQATAAIFARFLGIRPPAAANYPVPATLEWGGN
ncbi:MAG: phoV 1 [Gemmataceae bacterium]|nr:phoV 1 [Gemmataceae bacterium]